MSAQTAQAAPPSEPGPHPESVALIEAATTALAHDDITGYDQVVTRAEFGEVWLPAPAVLALQDREIEDLVAWSLTLGLGNADLIDVAYDTLEEERDAASATPESTTRAGTDELNDSDAAAAGLLEMIDRRAIDVSPPIRLAMSPVNNDQIPSPVQYDTALDELEELYGQLTAQPASSSDSPSGGQVSADPPSAEAETAAPDQPIENPSAEPVTHDSPSELSAATPSTQADSSSPIWLITAIALGASALLLGLFLTFTGRASAPTS